MSPSISPTASADKTATIGETMVAALRCAYANKRCFNLRTVKRKGGGLHRYCELHRLQANRNQRRVDLNRRLLRDARQKLLNESKGVAMLAPGLPDPTDISEHKEAFTPEDIELLSVFLEVHPVTPIPFASCPDPFEDATVWLEVAQLL